MRLNASALLQAIADRQEEMLAQIARLVNIDSGSYDALGVDAVGDALEALWAPLGFHCQRESVVDFGALRVFTRRLKGRGRVLILGHLDTVWPKGTVDDWPFHHEGDYAYGPGVGDMKGGLVMANAAARALIEAGFAGLGEIRHVLVPNEELGSAASRHRIEEEAAAADWVLVLEPARSNGAVVVARGAVGAVIAHAEGVSAHVIHHAEGASAIRALADKVSALEALSDYAHGESVNVGILRGGDARQVVARACEMHIDLRAPSQERGDILLANIMTILEAGSDPRVRLTVTGGITRPAFPSDASTTLYRRASEIAASLDLDYPAATTSGGSDGSFAAALGRPTLDGLGPVCLDSCSRRERIVTRSLVERGAVLASLIAQLPELATAGTERSRSWA